MSVLSNEHKDCMMKWHTHSLSKSTQTHTTCCLKIELIREGIPLALDDIWTWPSTTSLTCVMWQVKIRPKWAPHHFKNLSSSSHPSPLFLSFSFFPNNCTKLTLFLHPDYEDLLDCNCGLCALLLSLQGNGSNMKPEQFWTHLVVFLLRCSD